VAVLKAADHPLELTTLAEKTGASDQVEHVYKIARHLAANHRGVGLHGDYAKPGKLTVSYNPS
jgi:glucose-6-phosphate isomerase